MDGSGASRKVTAAKAGRDFMRDLKRVRARGDRICIKDQRGRVFAAIVPAVDLKRLELLEDFLDIMAAHEALHEGKRIPLKKVRAELGLDR